MLLLRGMGFIDVKVTKKSGDGGIDGFGKWQINGFITFNIAFQCKRYNNHPVTVKEIRNFRGAFAENFFGILKIELYYIKEKEYNNRRIKSKLKGMSPVQYRIHSSQVA